MSALRRVKKVKGGYEVTVSCTNKPTLTAFYRTYEQCGKFADDYFLDYLGVELKSVHHPEGDGIEPEGVNPDSLETVEIEIPMNIKQLAEQAGFEKQTHLIDSWECGLKELERFAELVRADEREACAVLVEGGNHVHPKAPDAIWAKTVAKLIRARGEPNPSFKNYMGDNWAGIV